jgi:hypothetical protein
MMHEKQEPLTHIEAEREFAKVGRAFNAYIEKTKHLGMVAILLAEFGDTGYIRTQDTDVPWVPFLYGAANLMARAEFTPDEVRETFESFISMVVMKQVGGCVPPSSAHRNVEQTMRREALKAVNPFGPNPRILPPAGPNSFHPPARPPFQPGEPKMASMENLAVKAKTETEPVWKRLENCGGKIPDDIRCVPCEPRLNGHGRWVTGTRRRWCLA